MNAGCFGKEFKDILLSIQAIYKKGNVLTIPRKDVRFGYRENNLSEDLIFISASFKGLKSEITKISSEIKRLKLRKIKINQQNIKTSGSTFKNPISQSKKKFGN